MTNGEIIPDMSPTPELKLSLQDRVKKFGYGAMQGMSLTMQLRGGVYPSQSAEQTPTERIEN